MLGRSSAPTLDEIVEETAALLVGAVIMIVALFPLALPLIALTAVVAIAAGLAALALGLPVALVATPILLLRRRRRRHSTA